MAATRAAAPAVARAFAVPTAIAALVGGYAHLSLYNDGYKDIPVGNIGPQFLLNAIAAAAIAAGLLSAVVVTVLPRWVGVGAALGAVTWGALSLVAFAVARADGGWFGFQDQPGLNPSPEAAMAVFAEAVAVVGGILLLVTLLAPSRRHPAG